MNKSKGKGQSLMMIAGVSVIAFVGVNCAGGDVVRHDADEGTGQTSEALVGGGDDGDTPARNAVVTFTNGGETQTENCTGTLVTSTRILTAGHCTTNSVSGSEVTNAVIVVGSEVRVGPTETNRDLQVDPGAGIFGTLKRSYVTKVEPAYTGDFQPGDQGKRAHDLAIVSIWPPIVSTTANDAAVPPVPPSFVQPKKPTLAPLQAGTGASPVSLDVLLIGWGALETTFATKRQTRTIFNAEFGLQGNPGQLIWLSNPTGYVKGDSGAPIFLTSIDGEMGDFVGIHSGRCTPEMGMCAPPTDLNVLLASPDETLSSNLRTFLLAKLRKFPSLPTSKWFGETDYVGACDKVHDPDCDRYYDTDPVTGARNDVCPGVYNPSQLLAVDATGDGIPDGPFVDDDGDGVPNYCDIDADNDGVPDAADNCPTVKNTDQRNCNSATEAANGAPLLGDACDPVPCPSLTTQGTKQSGAPLNIQILLPGPKTLVAGSIFGTFTTGGFRVETIPQHHLDGTPGAGVVGVAKTAYRFCIETDVVKCNASSVYDVSRIGPMAVARGGEGTPDAVRPWRRINVPSNIGAPVGSGPWDGEEGTVLYDAGKTFDRTWNWQADLAFWKSSFGSSVEQVNNPNGVAGVLGGYAATSAGLVPGAFGVHPIGDPAKLPNLPLGARKTGTQKYSFNALAVKNAALITAQCSGQPCKTSTVWAQDALGGATSVGEPSCAGTDLCLGAVAGDSVPVFRIPGNGQYAGVLESDGTIRQVSSGLGSGFRTALAGDDLLVGPSEPSSAIGNAATGPALLAVALDGAAVTGTFDWQGGVFGTRGDGCGIRCARGLAATSSTVRRDAHYSYARSLGRLFAAGGKDESGHARHDIVWQLVDEPGEWRALLVSATLHDIIAMTYAYGDRKLWVLDDIPGARVRLSRIDLDTGVLTEVGRFFRPRVFDRHWLVPDHDGGVLLVGSSSALDKHVIARFAVEGGGVKLSGLKLANGELYEPPHVSPSAYTFVLAGKKKNDMPTLRRLAHLEQGPGTWLDLNGCF